MLSCQPEAWRFRQDVARVASTQARLLRRLLAANCDTLFGKRHRFTLVHGRHSTPVEVILRMLMLKHLYQWSYQETEDQVDQNLILRWFCRLYWAPVPDDTTLIRWAQLIRPETLHALNDRVVELATQAKVIKALTVL